MPKKHKKDRKKSDSEEKMRLSEQENRDHAKSGRISLSKGYVTKPPAVVVCPHFKCL